MNKNKNIYYEVKYNSNVKNSLVFNVYWQGHKNFLQIAAQIEKLNFHLCIKD